MLINRPMPLKSLQMELINNAKDRIWVREANFERGNPRFKSAWVLLWLVKVVLQILVGLKTGAWQII